MAGLESTLILTPAARKPSELASLEDGGNAFVSILRFDPVSLRHYRRSLRLRSDRSALAALARAIAGSPGWPDGFELTFILRPEPEPTIGILAEPGILDPAHLNAHSHAFEGAVERLLYFGFSEAAKATESLAQKLLCRFGHEALLRCRFTAIPRGGLIVLGMLSSMLDLLPAQLSEGAGDAELLVIVDDCALTGARFGGFLSSAPAKRVVFAHLCSHPALRAAIVEQEPRVVACIASVDLQDHGSGRPAHGYTAAQARWAERLGSSRYWIGDCDRVCFPWNEPDRLVWNPATREVEIGWKLVPPQACFKRHAIKTSLSRIQTQPRGRGSLQPSPQVLFGRWRQEIVVARIDTGETFRLPGSAGAMWRALSQTGDLAAAQEILLGQYRVDEKILSSNLFNFLQGLLERGLFERSRS